MDFLRTTHTTHSHTPPTSKTADVDGGSWLLQAVYGTWLGTRQGGQGLATRRAELGGCAHLGQTFALKDAPTLPEPLGPCPAHTSHTSHISHC